MREAKIGSKFPKFSEVQRILFSIVRVRPAQVPIFPRSVKGGPGLSGKRESGKHKLSERFRGAGQYMTAFLKLTAWNSRIPDRPGRPTAREKEFARAQSCCPASERSLALSVFLAIPIMRAASVKFPPTRSTTREM